MGRKLRKNGELRGTPRIQVIGAQGEKLGTMTVAQGLRLALKQGLDLVEVNPKTVPTTCKLMDLDKYQDEAAENARTRRKLDEPEPE